MKDVRICGICGQKFEVDKFINIRTSKHEAYHKKHMTKEVVWYDKL